MLLFQCPLLGPVYPRPQCYIPPLPAGGLQNSHHQTTTHQQPHIPRILWTSKSHFTFIYQGSYGQNVGQITYFYVIV